MQINLFQSTPTFTGKLEIKSLRSITGVPCACCGRITLHPKKRQTACRSLEKPLKSVLGKLALSLEDKKGVLKTLSRLAKMFPTLSFNKIMENQDCKNSFIGCLLQYISSQNISKKQRLCKGNNFFDIIRLQASEDLRSASVVMKRLESFKKYLSEKNLEIFEQFEIYSQKYPRKSLSQIVMLDEVYDFHKTRNELSEKQNKDKLNFHCKNISKMIKKPFEEVLCKTEKIIDSPSCHYDLNTKRGVVKKAYLKILAKYNLTKQQKDKVLDEIDKFPLEGFSLDKFFIRAYNKKMSDSQIVSLIINPQECSFEHIVPKRNQGKDELSNGIILCRKCNSSRQTIPYHEYLQYHPEMKINTEKQIAYFSKKILSGELESDLRAWPIKVAKTLKDYTGGEIDIDTKSYRKKVKSKVEKQVSELKEQSNDILKEKKILQQRLAELDVQHSRLGSKLKDSNDLLKLLKE